MCEIEYRIVTEPVLMDNDNRRITFTGFDKASRREVVCQTAGNDEAPTLLKKLQGWSDVLIIGDYIAGGRGLLFRVDRILPKAQYATHN